MGRFETLNAETKDLVECLLPALAKSFGVESCVDLIPEDIRMRAWDCDRRDHIKDQTENDPRNWGVQFLKDLMAISRLKNGNLAVFQTDLRARVDLHEAKHPWCRLSDIKELKDEYEHPNRPPPVEPESAGTSSTDSYLEELHEPDLPSGRRGRVRNHEVYEARVQDANGSHGRLRRSEEGGFIRKDKSKGHGKRRYSDERASATPNSGRRSIKRRSRIVKSDHEDSNDSGLPLAYGLRSSSKSPTHGPVRASSNIATIVNTSNEPLAVQKLQAELEVAEAELRAARLKYQYITAKEQAEANVGDDGTETAPPGIE
ncbi:hypothetical protein CC86DRAFT_424662 [Ophiobolus disseminans]|uniref:Uncharacterized protein n=1 Tax=Ophiobolus disseminans TaxID=1469910 RepID=A0A6A7AI48_9PLEO|nr:hypothetical protein CC86DRAFT_424662 [Ophiobolus disseminans]